VFWVCLFFCLSLFGAGELRVFRVCLFFFFGLRAAHSERGEAGCSWYVSLSLSLSISLSRRSRKVDAL
jgi:hypothetical protein